MEDLAELLSERFAVTHNTQPTRPSDKQVFLQLMGASMQAFSPMSATVEDERAEGDDVIFMLTVRGQHTGSFGEHPPTLKHFVLRTKETLTINDGLIQALRIDHQPGVSLTEQLGLGHATGNRVIGNAALIPSAVDANHGPVDAACVVTPPGGRFAFARSAAFGLSLSGGSAIDGPGAAAAYALIKNQARNATGIGQLVTDRMAMILDADGVYVYEMHPKKLLVRRLLFAVPYHEIMDVRVEEGRESLVIVTLRSAQSFRLRGPGGGNNAAGVFHLVQQRASGHLSLPPNPASTPSRETTSAAPAHDSAESPPGQIDALEKLERLAALHASGHLSDEEFAAQKTRLLSAI